MKSLSIALVVFMLSFGATRLYVKPQLMASFVPSNPAPQGGVGAGSR
jgi:hypothetical protein